MENFAQIGKNILIITRYMKLYIKDKMKDHNLNYSEVMALLNFYMKDGISPEDIVEDLQHDKSLITRVTTALEEKGLLRREKNQADNRSIVFYLTEAAQKLKPEIIRILHDWQNHLLQNISTPDLAITCATTQIMVNNVSTNKK